MRVDRPRSIIRELSQQRGPAYIRGGRPPTAPEPTIRGWRIKDHTISALQIEAGTITAAEISVGALTAGTIAAGAITTEKLAAESVTAANIKAGAIEAGQIAANAITTEKLNAGAVTATTISAGAISTAKLQAGAVTAEKLAAESVTASKIQAHTITANEIEAGGINSGALATGAVTAGKLAAGAVEAANIKAGAIDGMTITGAIVRTATTGKRVVIDSEGLRAYNATEPVLNFDIASGNLTIKGTISEGSTVPAGSLTGTIGTTQIGNGAVTSAKIENGTILAEDIKAETITATQMAAGSISTKKLAAEAVTAEKIAVGTITAAQLSATAIDAMTITGATFRTSAATETVIDANGISLKAEPSSTEVKKAELNWYRSDTGKHAARIRVVRDADQNRAQFFLEDPLTAGHPAYLSLQADEEADSTETYARAVADSEFQTIIDGQGRSGFLQLSGLAAKRRLAEGSSSLTYPAAGSSSNVKEISHGLGSTPKVVLLTITGGTSAFNSWLRVTEKGETKFKVQAQNPGVPGATGSVEFDWIAIG